VGQTILIAWLTVVNKCSIFYAMRLMKGISGSTRSICEHVSWYKDTMTEQKYMGMVEFVPQLFLYLRKLEEQQELVYYTNSAIIVYKFFDLHCFLCTGSCIHCLSQGEHCQ
jgi:hypothetical protein